MTPDPHLRHAHGLDTEVLLTLRSLDTEVLLTLPSIIEYEALALRSLDTEVLLVKLACVFHVYAR